MNDTLKTPIYYYTTPSGDNPAQKFMDSLQKPQKAKIFRVIQYIKEYGLVTAIPHIKKLTGTPLWEIRILGEDNIRVIYSVVLKNSILILHGFIKKTQKTPPRELDTALNRLKDWKVRNIGID